MLNTQNREKSKAELIMSIFVSPHEVEPIAQLSEAPGDCLDHAVTSVEPATGLRDWASTSCVDV